MLSPQSEPGAIPVLLYHSVGSAPSAWIAPFTVSVSTLDRHLDLVAASGRNPVTVSQLRDGLCGAGPLPAAPVVVTFDDGFADTLTGAAPLLAQHGIAATIYLTSGFIGRRSPGLDRMLDWEQAAELVKAGHEIGAHSVSHPELDTIRAKTARREIADCRAVIQDRLGIEVRSFAYPHGYSSPTVRRLVAAAGYDTACSVKNALSNHADSQFSLARLMVTADTTDETVCRWLAGRGAPASQADERLAVRGWRGYRRARAVARAAYPRHRSRS